MSDKIPTADKLIKDEDSISYGYSYEKTNAIDSKTVKKLMIEFAKLHVKAALEAVNKNITTTCLADRFLDGYDFVESVEEDTENPYDPEND